MQLPAAHYFNVGFSLAYAYLGVDHEHIADVTYMATLGWDSSPPNPFLFRGWHTELPLEVNRSRSAGYAGLIPVPPWLLSKLPIWSHLSYD